MGCPEWPKHSPKLVPTFRTQTILSAWSQYGPNMLRPKVSPWWSNMVQKCPNMSNMRRLELCRIRARAGPQHAEWRHEAPSASARVAADRQTADAAEGPRRDRKQNHHTRLPQGTTQTQSGSFWEAAYAPQGTTQKQSGYFWKAASRKRFNYPILLSCFAGLGAGKRFRGVLAEVGCGGGKWWWQEDREEPRKRHDRSRDDEQPKRSRDDEQRKRQDRSRDETERPRDDGNRKRGEQGGRRKEDRAFFLPPLWLSYITLTMLEHNMFLLRP